ncbi:hypothetical protein D9M70_630060 [compost metagenome]
MGNGGAGFFLHVVRWQPVILRPDVLIEERPGLARQQPQEGQLLCRGFEHRLFGGRTESPGEPGTGEPRQQQRTGNGQCLRLVRQQGQRDQGRYRLDPHLAIEAGQPVFSTALHLA